MRKIILSKEQENFIVENYKTMKLKEIANDIGISLKVLSRIVKKLGLNNARKNPPRTVLTKEIQDKIKELYSHHSNEEICEILNLHTSTLSQYACKIGLKKEHGYIYKNFNGSSLTKEQKRFIYQNYSKFDNKYLSEKLGVSPDEIRNYACGKGLKKNSLLVKRGLNAFDIIYEKRFNENYNYISFLGHDKEPLLENSELYKSKYGKYYVNIDYFNKIDNEWKAYWLGFLYADGCNDTSNNCVRLKLQKRDKLQIIKFKNSLQSDANLKVIKSNRHTLNGREIRSGEQVEINICGKKLSEDLSRLGCVRNKTYILQFPNNDILPDFLMRHFIRGYFDGDGWVSVNIDRKIMYVGFVGMQCFIEPLKDYLVNKLNIENVTIRRRKNRESKAVEISWSSILDCEKLFNYLYNNCNIYLERKFLKFNNVLCLGQYEV